ERKPHVYRSAQRSPSEENILGIDPPPILRRRARSGTCKGQYKNSRFVIFLRAMSCLIANGGSNDLTPLDDAISARTGGPGEGRTPRVSLHRRLVEEVLGHRARWQVLQRSLWTHRHRWPGQGKDLQLRGLGQT